MNTTVATMPNQSFSTVLQDNKTNIARIEEFKNTVITTGKRNLAFAGLSVGCIFVLGFFAFQIISGALALAVTGIVCAGGWYGLRYLKAMDPVIRQKMKNRTLEHMYNEARENSIFQLDNQIIVRTSNLEKAKKSRDEMGSKVELMRSRLDGKGPDSRNYEQKEKILSRVQMAYDQIVNSVGVMRKNNKEFELKVQDYKEMKEFADIAADAMSIFQNNNGLSLQDMLSLEAFEAIDNEFNTSLVSIENTIRDLSQESDLAEA